MSLTSTPAATGLTAGTWQIDPAHSTVGFAVRHLGLSKVRGGFATFEGEITIDADQLASRVRAAIDLASVDTNHPERDAHLRGTDFFDADTRPRMTFVSTAVEPAGGDYRLLGDLTIGEVTRPVELTLEFHGVGDDPYGNHKAGFSAAGSISRSDFGIDFNVPLGADAVLIGDKVSIDLDIQAALVS